MTHLRLRHRGRKVRSQLGIDSPLQDAKAQPNTKLATPISTTSNKFHALHKKSTTRVKVGFINSLSIYHLAMDAKSATMYNGFCRCDIMDQQKFLKGHSNIRVKHPLIEQAFLVALHTTLSVLDKILVHLQSGGLNEEPSTLNWHVNKF
jgi:hypothetical protein